MTTENNISAEDTMALTSGISAFESKQFVRAYELLFPLAEKGNTDALYRLAIISQNGLGMVANKEKALAWMQSAAEQGFDLAQHGLGFMYMEGECVEQDYAQAIHWFKLASEQGLAGAQATLGNMYQEGLGVEPDLDEAKRWFAKAGF
jgi:TPR repeat protein